MSELVEQLAWDLVACAQRPPIHPTTCAVMRLLAVLGEVSFRKCADLVPCDVETVRQQLNRLCIQGLVQREAQRRLGRKAQSVYRLTFAGRQVVRMWSVAYEARMAQLKREL